MTFELNVVLLSIQTYAKFKSPRPSNTIYKTYIYN